MEWYFTFEQGMYETHMHLPICVDIFWMRNVSDKWDTNILRIAISSQVLRTSEYSYTVFDMFWKLLI